MEVFSRCGIDINSLLFRKFFKDIRLLLKTVRYKYFEYSKTREDLCDILTEKGSLEDAKRRARKRYQEFMDAKVSSMSAMVPATRVYELIEELESYLQN